MKLFSEMPLLPEIQKSLEVLGFTEPTEIQEKVIPMLIDNLESDIMLRRKQEQGKLLHLVFHYCKE